MKQILLLTDFSQNSINAIQYALHLFKGDTCKFYILHVKSSKAFLSDDLVMSGGQSIYDSILKKSKQQLLELIDDIESEFKNENFTFQKLIDYDGLTDAINQLKASYPIDLIVMGSNGVTGAKETIFGSNTINVIRNVDCPTLIIPEGFTYKKTSELLLPLDSKDTLNSSTFSELLNFAQRFSDKIHLLRVEPYQKKSEEQCNDIKHIKTLVKDLDYNYYVIDGVPMEYAVSCYTQTHAIDLMALLVQKENLLGHIFTSSSTSKISNTLRVPLVVYHS